MMRATIAWLAFVVGWVFIIAAAIANAGHRPNGLSLLGVLLLLLCAYLLGVFKHSFWVPDEAENEHCNETDRELTKEGL